MKKIVKKAVKRKKQQPKIVRYYFDDAPQSYSHGGNVKNEYNQLVGRVGDEYYFLNYIFHHSDGFQGATGDVIMPVSKGYYDYTMSREGIIERYVDSMGEDEWIDVLGIDREEYEDEDKLIEAIEDGIYDLFLAGQLHPFEEVDYDAESEMRTLPKFQDSDEFPIFEVVGVGRIFSGDISFDDIYNQELYDKIKEVEGFKEGGELNKMVKIYYNSQIPFYKKDKNKYEIYENTPFLVVPKTKVGDVIFENYTEGDWKNYLVPELMTTENKIIHHRKDGEKYENGGGVGIDYNKFLKAKTDQYRRDGYDLIDAIDTAFRDLGLETNGKFEKSAFDKVVASNPNVKKAWTNYKKESNIYVKDGYYVNPYQMEYAKGGSTYADGGDVGKLYKDINSYQVVTEKGSFTTSSRDELISKLEKMGYEYKGDVTKEETTSANPIYDFSWKLNAPKFKGLFLMRNTPNELRYESQKVYDSMSMEKGGGADIKSKKTIKKKQPKMVRQYFEDRPYSYASGGGTYVDLFEDYENIPLKVQKIFDKYAEEFGDYFDGMDYKETQNMLEEIEEVGYTFGYGLDNQPYGLRPMGVRLNQLKNFEDYDDDDFAGGGRVNNGYLYFPIGDIDYQLEQGKIKVGDIVNYVFHTGYHTKYDPKDSRVLLDDKFKVVDIEIAGLSAQKFGEAPKRKFIIEQISGTKHPMIKGFVIEGKYAESSLIKEDVVKSYEENNEYADGGGIENSKEWKEYQVASNNINRFNRQNEFIMVDGKAVMNDVTKMPEYKILNEKFKESLKKVREMEKERNNSYAEGGEADLEYSDILNVLKSKIDDSIEEMPMDYENAYNFKGEEVEHESRDGFIPYTDGGYEAVWFEYLDGMWGAGKSLPTKSLDDEMNRQIDYNLDSAKNSFVNDYPEIVEELGIENIDYNSLYEAGYGEEAEMLSSSEMEMMGEDTIMMQVSAFYYTPENSRAVDGKHTIRLFGDVNLESPYHRAGNLDDSYEFEFTFDSIDVLETEMAIGIAKILSWFNGDMYNESNTEMKVRRMAEGGSINYGGEMDSLKRFDVDFYDNSDANRETSIELIIKQESLDNAIQDAIKKAYELKKNYIEFYHRGFFLGSINFANSKEFVKGKYYDNYISNNLYAEGGEAGDYYEQLAVYVQGVGSIYNGKSMKKAVEKANSYLSKNKKAEIVIVDEKYGDEYDLDGNMKEEYAEGGEAGKEKITEKEFRSKLAELGFKVSFKKVNFEDLARASKVYGTIKNSKGEEMPSIFFEKKHREEWLPVIDLLNKYSVIKNETKVLFAEGGSLGDIGKPYSFDVIATKKSGEKIKELRVGYAENKEIAKENLLEFLKNKLHYTKIKIIGGREGHEKRSQMATGGGVENVRVIDLGKVTKVVGDYNFAKIIHYTDTENLRAIYPRGYVVYFYKADGTYIKSGLDKYFQYENEYKDALQYAKENVNNIDNENYAKGGQADIKSKKTIKKKQPKMVRQYFEDRPYSYAEGGEVSEWMEEALASLIEETDYDDLEITIVSDNGNEFIATDDNVEYRVFKTEEDAEEKAIEQVLQDLEEMPESFNQEWLSNFFEAENFFREILEEYNYGYATDIMTEDDDLYANRLIREMIDWGIMTKEQAMNSDAEQIASDNIQDFVNLLTDDQCTNGAFEYYANEFGKEEAYNLAVSNNLLDFQEASENAVMLDGIGHFLSSYDGETIYLTSNSVAYRNN